MTYDALGICIKGDAGERVPVYFGVRDVTNGRLTIYWNDQVIYDTEARNPRWEQRGRKDPEARHSGMKAKAGVNQIKAVFRRQNLHKKSSAWFSMVGDCMHVHMPARFAYFVPHCARFDTPAYVCVCAHAYLRAHACMSKTHLHGLVCADDF